MKYVYLLFLVSFLACESKDTKICDCLKASEKLNKASSKFFMNDFSEKEMKAFQKLKKEKIKKCADYQTMSGEEMIKRKNECDQ